MFLFSLCYVRSMRSKDRSLILLVVLLLVWDRTFVFDLALVRWITLLSTTSDCFFTKNTITRHVLFACLFLRSRSFLWEQKAGVIWIDKWIRLATSDCYLKRNDCFSRVICMLISEKSFVFVRTNSWGHLD